jgi:hypothetical protein
VPWNLVPPSSPDVHEVPGPSHLNFARAAGRRLVFWFFKGAEFGISPLFRGRGGKNHNPSYRGLSSTLSDGTHGVFVGSADFPIPLDIPIQAGAPNSKNMRGPHAVALAHFQYPSNV